jgi:hypoxanthine phosphoribosyltransferase
VAEERERLSWAAFGEASRSLATEIHESGFEPDIILAIARGGLLVAGALGYALSVKNLYTMNVEYYTGVDQRLDVPMILPPIPDPAFLSNAQVLIADDVADTGHTLAAVEEFCTGKVAEVRSAVLYEKPRSVVKCQYVWKTTDRWIEFPWSVLDPVAPPKTGRVVRDA